MAHDIIWLHHCLVVVAIFLSSGVISLFCYVQAWKRNQSRDCYVRSETGIFAMAGCFMLGMC